MTVEGPRSHAGGRHRSMFGWGAASRLGEIVARRDPVRVVLVAGPRSYGASGAAEQLGPVLAPFRVTRIDRSEAYPTLEDVARGRVAMLEADPDLMIAVGGGAVLDFAKSMRARYSMVGAGPSARLELDPAEPVVDVPLVAIPTTAGTGAETTQFAVLYVDGIKHSLDHPGLRPDVAIVDPALTASVGPRGTAASGMDALAQGLESIWSVASSAHSRRYAIRAARLALGCLEEAAAGGRAARSGMSMAAHLSGRAINETRTTACHAVSYPMTVRHGIPHGHAVALTLPAMLEFNAGVTTDDVLDPGGVEAVQMKIDIVLDVLGAANPAAGRRRLLDLMRRLSLETTLAELGVQDLEPIVAEGFNPARSGNNPRRLTPEVLRTMLAGTW